MRFQGQPFAPAQNLEDRRKLGVVPQNLAVYENLSARENLEFFGRLNGFRGPRLRDEVNHALQLAGLVERANDRVREYSGGMKRRLNLAVGVIHRPELLLLDEPTVGVDAQSRNQIFEALCELRRAGHTLLYTTHYMEEAQRLCDRVAVMHEGAVIAFEPQRGIYNMLCGSLALNGITTSGFTIGQGMSITSVKEGKAGSTTIDEFDAHNRQIAETLALSHSTSEVAHQFGISAGRVAQLRRELHESWRDFHGE
jgi:ABC-type multidrug transport system ATPase subunit